MLPENYGVWRAAFLYLHAPGKKRYPTNSMLIWYKPTYITSDSDCHLQSSVAANAAVAGICETDGLAARYSCPPPPGRVYCDEWEESAWTDYLKVSCTTPRRVYVS